MMTTIMETTGVTDVATTDFPFVHEMPKREKSRVQKLWEHLQEMNAIVAVKGQLLPVKFSAALVGVSQQRIDQLAVAGQIERVYFHEHPFITENSLVAWAKSERKAGRPVKLPSTLKERCAAVKTLVASKHK